MQGSQQHQSESLDEMDMVCSVSEPANNDLVVERASRAWPTFGEDRLARFSDCQLRLLAACSNCVRNTIASHILVELDWMTCVLLDFTNMCS